MNAHSWAWSSTHRQVFQVLSDEKPLISQRYWRRERDSNPRGLGGPCGFQVRRLACCLVSPGVVLITNHDSAVVASCCLVPPRLVGVGYGWGYEPMAPTHPFSVRWMPGP